MRPDIASTGCVLHVLDHSWPVLSGYSVRSRNLIRAQHRSGQAIVAVTSPLQQLDDPGGSDVVLDEVSYLRTPITGRLAASALRRRWPVIREWETVRLLRDQLLRIVDSRPISLIYAHSPALCGLAAVQAARMRRLRVAYEIRAFWEDAAVDQKRTTSTSLRYKLSRALENYVIRNVDAVSAIARPMLEDLRGRGVPGNKLFHVPNGVDADEFTPAARDLQLAKKLGVDGHMVFGFFGSLYRYEGVAWMIGALSELHKRGRRFKLLIIGSGEDEAPIREAIAKHQASEYVCVLARVPHEEIRKYYSIADVMVFPRLSVRLTELVTPLKPLEAMALQKAVLASDVGGHRELVEHGRTGLLFRAGDASDFCDQAERLTDSPHLRKKLGENAREVILRDWDWKVVARRYQQIYQFVLQEGGKSGRSFRSQPVEVSAAGGS